MCAVAAVAVVLAVSACNKKGEIFEQQMDTIRSWVESRNENGSAYTEIMSGVFRDTVNPEEARGTPLAERGDSLYLMYEVYKFSTSFSETSTGDLIYTNRPERMPDRVEWNRDTLRIVLGEGKLMKGVEERALVMVLMTPGNAYGDHTVQQLPPNTPVAWRVNVEKVIENQ